MRTERCVCGGVITAPSLKQAGPYVEAHGLMPIHQAWRSVRESWNVYQTILVGIGESEKLHSRPPHYRDPRLRSTAGTTSRDLSGSKPGASAGAEGAA